MAIYKSNTQETTTTAGTGALTLAGATAGNRTFDNALTVNDWVPYHIKASDGGWEWGYGKYTATNTLARTYVIDSSNAGAALNLPAGTHTVSLAPIPGNQTPRGYRLTWDSGQTITTGFPAAIEWDRTTPEWDSEGVYDALSGANSDLLLPDWVGCVRVTCQLLLSGTGTGTVFQTLSYSDGAGGFTAAKKTDYGLDTTLGPPMHIGGRDLIVPNNASRALSLLMIQTTGANITPFGSDSWAQVDFIS